MLHCGNDRRQNAFNGAIREETTGGLKLLRTCVALVYGLVIGYSMQRTRTDKERRLSLTNTNVTLKTGISTSEKA